MLQESDAAELRALQAKAYGRHGGLTDADAARLRELEAVRAVVPDAEEHAASAEEPAAETTITGSSAVEPRSTDDEMVDSGDVPRAAGVAVTGDAAGADSDDAGEEPRSPSGVRAILRQHWKVVAAASVLLLVVGLGAGWTIFGRDNDGVSLTAEQQERRTELQADGDFDAGSLRAIGQDDDALVWYATKDDGELICLTLDIPGESATQCHRTEDFESGNGVGIGVSATSQGDDEDEPAQQVWASVARAMSGEMVAFVQRWDVGVDDWLSQFEGEERERAEQLGEDGFEPYALSVVGYFQDEPVWYGQRLEGDRSRSCLVVDALAEIRCVEASGDGLPESGIGIAGVTFDESGDESTPWSVMLDFTTNGTPYLVINGDAPAVRDTVEPGETLELGGESQDPIQVEVPSDDAEG